MTAKEVNVIKNSKGTWLYEYAGIISGIIDLARIGGTHLWDNTHFWNYETIKKLREDGFIVKVDKNNMFTEVRW